MAGLPVVAVVGRPNVGKSTLFNRIVGMRQAIVEDRARTTRDRIYGTAEWNGRRFTVVDTGGLEISPADDIEARVQEQARLAIGEADVILFVVDAAVGPTPADLEAAELLRHASAPVLVAVNKADSDKRELDAAEFYALGWEETYPVSALHGRGTGDLLDALVWALPRESADELARKQREAEADAWARDLAAGRLERARAGRSPRQPAAGDEAGDEADLAAEADALAEAFELPGEAVGEAEPVGIALVGRPNVGKSSLLNALLGQDRAIVSDIPGTTRDTIDTHLAWGLSDVLLIDTAGIRRRGKVANGPAAERYSTLRALKAIARADVAVLLLDATDGLTAQDAHVAGYVVDEGKGLVVAVNKWDLLAEKTDRTFDEYAAAVRSAAPFLDFAPIVSISARSGQRVGRVLELAVDIWGEQRKRIPTAELNRVLGEAARRQTPPLVKGHRPKLFYGTQVAVVPPTFVLFARDAAAVHFSYRRYLENRLRAAFGFDGTPIRLVFRERQAVKLPPRRRAAGPPGGRRAGPARFRRSGR
ncbi:MAG TPA: ribosome biogenesis GTPase Der [Candidatus Limnocylindrales bacterium]